METLDAPETFMPKKKKGAPAAGSEAPAAPEGSADSAAAAESKDLEMLANGDEADEGGEAEQRKGNRREGADISRVTDYVEQKEALDSTKASQAMRERGWSRSRLCLPPPMPLSPSLKR